MLRHTSTATRKPTKVPTTPTEAPVIMNTRMMAPWVTPIVRNMPMSRPLSFTSMISPEVILNAATITIMVRIRNITLRSTWSALKKVALRWRQSTMKIGQPAPDCDPLPFVEALQGTLPDIVGDRRQLEQIGGTHAAREDTCGAEWRRRERLAFDNGRSELDAVHLANPVGDILPIRQRG